MLIGKGVGTLDQDVLYAIHQLIITFVTYTFTYNKLRKIQLAWIFLSVLYIA